MKIICDHAKKVEISVEFPISILCEYNGRDNLDVTLDDNITYLIDEALRKAGVYVKNKTMKTYYSEKNEEILSYQLTLIVWPPGLNLYCIVNDLTQENFHQGLCIKLQSQHHGFSIVYADSAVG
ncbi:hypothetical protein [Janthinobacterium sp. BJB304]|uniref:hypothetical protein n=1 Tax=Janthinobacterium sp. BJB304 TaxID=1572871 RepID=UPI001179F290|nr:hypothetical protein [Janthinobacterium sp. BJB304]